MKIITIIGARPQFVKAAAVSRAIAEYNKNITHESSLITERIVHTGQHYDDNMSEVFFRELEIPKPAINLGIGSGFHGQQTGQMLIRIEEVLKSEDPDWVLVYGDTNSTLAGSLASAKLHIPVVHVEAGLRSFNKIMPEEINRLLTDHLSSLLFCPTEAAVNNLQSEGITEGVFLIGDVMLDSFQFNLKLAEAKSTIVSALNINPGAYSLATIHREENTTNVNRLSDIFKALEKLATPECPVIAPLHPRTMKELKSSSIYQKMNRALRIIEPVSYLDMVVLEINARIILTDSGGVQKEAYFAKVPCITLRSETEWVELVETGCNKIAGTETESICIAYVEMLDKFINFDQELYGGGKASFKIVDLLYNSGHIK
jgi:UDP-GlcNAc3NAcA epimerase